MRYNLKKLKKIVCEKCELTCSGDVKCNSITEIEKIFSKFSKDWRVKAIQKANSNKALRKKTQEGLKKFRNS